jgi:hypothetical protein
MMTLDKIIPVIPPIVNKIRKAIANSTGVFTCRLPTHIVAIQLKILIPVGTAMIIVIAWKKALVSKSRPVVYRW